MFRVELTVNLPKLEPFIPEEKDRWSISPSQVTPKPLRRAHDSTPLLQQKPQSAQNDARLSMPVILVEPSEQQVLHMERLGEERESDSSPEIKSSTQPEAVASTEAAELPGELGFVLPAVETMAGT